MAHRGSTSRWHWCWLTVLCVQARSKAHISVKDSPNADGVRAATAADDDAAVTAASRAQSAHAPLSDASAAAHAPHQCKGSLPPGVSGIGIAAHWHQPLAEHDSNVAAASGQSQVMLQPVLDPSYGLTDNSGHTVASCDALLQQVSSLSPFITQFEQEFMGASAGTMAV